MTNKVLTKAFTPTEEDLEKIKSFTQRDFAPEELFIFKMVLCTNEADRDFDVFSPAALQDMKKLFIGKPGLKDHIAGTDYQTARIFDTYIEEGAGKGYDGSPLLCLKAKAYIPRCDETEAVINSVEAGIKREVSVSCAIGKSHCSICGEGNGCSHIPGKKYGGKVCARIIDGVTDAYEWSFVAVPAQRYAGVTKAFKGGDENMKSDYAESKYCQKSAEFAADYENYECSECCEPDETSLKKRLNTGTEVTLSAAEATSVVRKMAENEELRKLASAYKDVLKKYAIRLAQTVPGADMESFGRLLNGMSAGQLREFNAALKGCEECKQFNEPGGMPAPQLSPVNEEGSEIKNLNEFKI